MLHACMHIDLFEKTVNIPNHSWKSEFRPEFTFTIKDTSSPYDVHLILRHSDLYHFNNIWLNVGIKRPGVDSTFTFKVNARLATNDKGWLGAGMDDIYEHRISLINDLINNNISLKQAGTYTITLQQIMREDPLENVLNAGIKLEKK